MDLPSFSRPPMSKRMEMKNIPPWLQWFRVSPWILMTTTVSVPCNDVIPKSDYFLDIYGTSKVADSTVTNRLANGHNALKKTRTVIHLSLRDSLPAYGPIASMTFSLAKNGVGRLFSTITYYTSSHRLFKGSSCSRTCCCYRIWPTGRIYLVPGSFTLPYLCLFSLSIRVA